MVDNLETLQGVPIKSWRPGDALSPETVPRLERTWDNEDELWMDLWAQFLELPDLENVTDLVIGDWNDSYEQSSAPIVEALVAASERFPNLKHLFFGDIESEQCEISWIVQSDLSPLFGAFPALEYFGVRGGNGLQLGSPRHENLRSLVVETGGLEAAIVRDLLKAQLPKLEHFEIYLGDENYGGTVTTDDLRPLLDGLVFPNLKSLGLRDCAWGDALAAAVADAPILARIETLDLSLGTLGDEGAQKLLESEAVSRLQKLDVHYHFCTDQMVEKLKTLPLEVDARDPQSGDEWDGEVHRYIAVSE